MDLVEVLREKRGVDELPIMMLMVPGMGVRGVPGGAPKGGGGGGGEAKAGGGGREDGVRREA
ncbi:hypothetical protein E2542_SST20281 [Spatholobus suberectus]|nr:hypothetical protein E2542_SST20281 [Spatholobus suberectus]